MPYKSIVLEQGVLRRLSRSRMVEILRRLKLPLDESSNWLRVL